ncbi:hypothetical protein [Clostridium hydrogenum]|uniref:hypothetical protein n=1 Tax=Clostridium hydrogenum TaxID=2855764 RepID=UPI001F380F2C|nr:hypothetical protein [Clostridium hydrogenum]
MEDDFFMLLLNNVNKNLKEKLNILLSECKRFDITIESILDEEYNNIKIFVDNLSSPTIIEIIQGTFIIFAEMQIAMFQWKL